jgi:hypothetical protein
MSVKMRQRIERKIAHAFIRDALAAGYVISVNDGEETTLIRSTSIKAILGAMFTTDEDRLYIDRPDDPVDDRRCFGWVLFIYGNDGYDVISDYTVNLEPLMKNPNLLANRYS